MRQSHYEEIINCIKFGAPALANELIVDLNDTVNLANQKITENQEAERRKTEEQLKKAQEEKAKKADVESKVTKK